MAETHTRLTLEDISKEIHISRTTIYKVINNKGTVSEKTRETVLAALEKYDYVPNNNARNLALNKKYNIALINFESPDASYFATSIDCGIRQAIGIMVITDSQFKVIPPGSIIRINRYRISIRPIKMVSGILSSPLPIAI